MPASPNLEANVLTAPEAVRTTEPKLPNAVLPFANPLVKPDKELPTAFNDCESCDASPVNLRNALLASFDEAPCVRIALETSLISRFNLSNS